MDAAQRYELDRCGYLILPALLAPEDVAALSLAVERLEAHALARVADPPRVRSPWLDMTYHRDDDLGYHAHGGCGPGASLIIEDFWNADSTFDRLLSHAATMDLIQEVIRERPTVNNSEIRIRYRGNHTSSHMGGGVGHKYRYGIDARGFDCMMMRMIYFLSPGRHDDGAFCVVPGSHKSAIEWPYACAHPATEPGMVPVEVGIGDAILFTENLRHGGFTNHSQRPRRTIHVGYGPHWMLSQNMATMDEPQFLLPRTAARLSAAQRGLFMAHLR